MHAEQSAQSVKELTAEYKIDNKSVYDILGLICKDTNLYPDVKQHKAKQISEGHFMTFIPDGYAQII